MNANGQHDDRGGREDIDWMPDPNDPDDYTEAAAKQMIEESTAPAEGLRRQLTQALVEAGFDNVDLHPGPQGWAWELVMNHGRNPPYQSAMTVEIALRRIAATLRYTIPSGGALARVEGERITAAFTLSATAQKNDA